MSQENVETLRRMYAGFERGDYESSMPLMDENIVLVVWSGLPEGVSHGPSGMREHLASLFEAWDSLTMAADSYSDAGDSVIVDVRHQAVGASSGVPIEMNLFHLWSFRGGKVIRLDVIPTEAEALEAVGLRE
jgi:uncharacterized protein